MLPQGGGGRSRRGESSDEAGELGRGLEERSFRDARGPKASSWAWGQAELGREVTLATTLLARGRWRFLRLERAMVAKKRGRWRTKGRGTFAVRLSWAMCCRLRGLLSLTTALPERAESRFTEESEA